MHFLFLWSDSNWRWPPSTILNLNAHAPIQVTCAYDINKANAMLTHIFQTILFNSCYDMVWLCSINSRWPPSAILNSMAFYFFKSYARNKPNETNFMLSSHFYTICVVIGYDNIQMWPWIQDGCHMPCWIFMNFFIVPLTNMWHMNEINFSHNTIVCINLFLGVTVRLNLDLGNQDGCHPFWQDLMVFN